MKLFKTIAVIAAVGIIALSSAAFSACGFGSDSGSGSGGTTPPNANEQTDSGSGNSSQNTADGENEYSQYSLILQSVLTNPYYDELARQRVNLTVGNRINEQYAIPFKFLKNKGHDVNAIKAGELSCITNAYIKGNEKDKLYVSVKVENEYGAGNYYTNYVLSYTLTEQEYADLEMLHKNKYLQAPYFIQELDNQKTAKIETCTKIGVETYDKLYATCRSWNNDLYLFKNFTIDLVKIDSKDLFTVAFVSVPTDKKLFDGNGTMRFLNIKANLTAEPNLSNSILYINSPQHSRLLNLEEFETTFTTISCFNSQNNAPTDGSLKRDLNNLNE